MVDDMIREPICFACKHLLGWPICRAFLGGIPKDIRDGKDEHRTPREGDGGIQFEPLQLKR